MYGRFLEDDGTAGARLMKQGVRQSEVYFHDTDGDQVFVTLSQSLVVQCNTGERVWVESPFDENFIENHHNKNTFSGVLLSLD